MFRHSAVIMLFSLFLMFSVIKNKPIIGKIITPIIEILSLPDILNALNRLPKYVIINE